MNWLCRMLCNFCEDDKDCQETIKEQEAIVTLLEGDLKEQRTVNGGLLRQVAELLAEHEIPKPVTNLTKISRAEFLTEMGKVGISPIDWGTPLDSLMTITSEVELERIAPELTYPANLYIVGIQADCEDYGLKAQVDAGFKYHVTGIRLGLGHMPLGYHGFAVTLSKEGNIWLLEPNAGFPHAGKWFKIGEHGYKPNKIFA